MTTPPQPDHHPHHQLRAVATRCERAAREHHSTPQPHHRHAAALLTTTATALRTAADALAHDPTLATEPTNTGRLRPVDLLAELGRQLIPLLHNATRLAGPHHQPTGTPWAEADALAAHIGDLAVLAAQHVPHPDHATPTGARAIHTARLAAQHTTLDQAAKLLVSALPNPVHGHSDPRATRIHTLTTELTELADELADDHEHHQTLMEAQLRPAARP